MKNFVVIGLMLFLGACSSKIVKEETKQGASMEAKQVAVEEEATYVTEFAFPKGGKKIPAEAQAEIRKNMQRALKRGNVKDVKVITWADAEYPSVHTKKLTASEVTLVTDRNKVLEDFLKKISGEVKVTTYSMAERPGTIKELFNTSDAQIKKSLETAGVPTTDTAVKVPSKASKSIVLITMD